MKKRQATRDKHELTQAELLLQFGSIAFAHSEQNVITGSANSQNDDDDDDDSALLMTRDDDIGHNDWTMIDARGSAELGADHFNVFSGDSSASEPDGPSSMTASSGKLHWWHALECAVPERDLNQSHRGADWSSDTRSQVRRETPEEQSSGEDDNEPNDVGVTPAGAGRHYKVNR